MGMMGRMRRMGGLFHSPLIIPSDIAICLIHQTNYLVDQQLRRLERDFLERGGLRERMTQARLQYRRSHPLP
jgi:four helix bundle suffix protein